MKGKVHIICGNGRGKTSSAIGRAIVSAEHEKTIIMIQFLKGNQAQSSAFMRRLEPEFKVFAFEKQEIYFDLLSARQKKDEISNIQNGLNFAKKVMVTGECDVLILDEVLGLLDFGILTAEELANLIRGKNDEMELILTGSSFPAQLKDLADEISVIENGK